MKIGILGLPNIGKSTLFNAITNAGAQVANFPFCTIEPNVGVVAVPDSRLDKLADIYKPESFVPATIEFVDIAGLVKGASKGEGLGNKFLSFVRDVDALVHVVRCFDGNGIIHVEGNTDPVRDIDIINLELILSDLEFVEKRIEKTEKLAKNNKLLSQELALLYKIKDALNNEIPSRNLTFDKDETQIVESLNLLTFKPLIYVANINENDTSNEGAANIFLRELQSHLSDKNDNSLVIPICAKIESEVAELSKDEKELFLDDLGIKESGLDKLIKASYSALGLISYLTAGPKEVRAWTIKKGTKAPQAAGKIHTDFEKGFIRAEIVSFDDLIQCGSYNSAKEKGLMRSEGKDYIMKDGDVVLFRFNV